MPAQWFAALLLKFRDRAGNIVRRQHFAARRIHFQDDCLDLAVFLGAFELRLDHVHHAVTGLVNFATGDDAINVHDGDPGRRAVVFEQHFFQPRAGVMMRLQSFHANEAAKKTADVEQNADREQEQ